MENRLPFDGTFADKTSARKYYLHARRSLETTLRVESDKALCEQLNHWVEKHPCEAIAAYVSDGTEPNLMRFLEIQFALGRRIAFPKSEVDANHIHYTMHWVDSLTEGWEIGAYGIREPKWGTHPMSDAERTQNKKLLWLIPGVAFTLTGDRLGRGKSIYDRLLLETTGTKAGIFYDCQEAHCFPTELHDQPLDVIMTPTRILSVCATNS